jgi:type II secretory pathway component GspD/PulD (secretin)
MRCISCLTILSLSLVVGTFLDAEENKTALEPSASGVRRAARDQEKRVLHSLSQRITIEAVDMPLKDVLQQVSQVTEREILIDGQGLADEGISTSRNDLKS